ncbi:MAG: DNA recombination protein RmuC [Parvibaculales bacterium]
MESSTLVIVVLLIALAGMVVALLKTLAQNHKDPAEAAQAAQLQTLLAEIDRKQTELTGSLNSFAQAQETARGELNRNLAERLDTVSRNVGDNLRETGEKTTKTLSDLGERLATIDAAQQQITALSGQVVDLQNILNNKQARGAFGETQLADIVRDGLPENAFELQHTLSNNKRADCLIRLPNPPGPVVVDSKFPLEAFKRYSTAEDPAEKKDALNQLGRDTLKHAQDISDKYILSGETADAALMFLPSESVFSELHLALPEIVDKCRALRVYPVSPNTMSLTLNTVRAIMRDVKMREQAGLIQKEVGLLMDDIARLGERVGKLRSHFSQANKDIEQIETSTKKIDQRGHKITGLELEDGGDDVPSLTEG